METINLYAVKVLLRQVTKALPPTEGKRHYLALDHTGRLFLYLELGSRPIACIMPPVTMENLPQLVEGVITYARLRAKYEAYPTSRADADNAR